MHYEQHGKRGSSERCAEWSEFVVSYRWVMYISCRKLYNLSSQQWTYKFCIKTGKLAFAYRLLQIYVPVIFCKLEKKKSNLLPKQDAVVTKKKGNKENVHPMQIALHS
jgi:hypothetical protein